jgi:hypothetical protein
MPFVNRLLEFHNNKALREFREYNEAAFQTAVESLLPYEYWVSEVRLVTNDNSYAFADVFLSGKSEQMCGGNSNVVLELKLISLLGLASGEKGKWIGNIDYNLMQRLDNDLKNESEVDLLERDYYYWCKDKKTYKTTTIQKIVDSGIEQINRYIKLLKKGSVTDKNVEVIVGSGMIGGWLVIAIGSQRILTKKIEFKRINYEFILR